MKKVFGAILITIGIVTISKYPNFGKQPAETVGALIGISSICFLPAYFLLRGSKNKQNEISGNVITNLQVSDYANMMSQKTFEELTSIVTSKRKDWVENAVKAAESELRKRDDSQLSDQTFNKQLQNIIINNLELKQAVIPGNKQQIEDFLSKNTSILDDLADEIIYKDAPSEKYLTKATDQVYMKHDYLYAIDLINEGLKCNDNDNNPYLHSLRSECFEKLNKMDEALADINAAIKLIDPNSPHIYYNLYDFYKSRNKLKTKIGDISGSNADNAKALAFLQVYELTKDEGK